MAFNSGVTSSYFNWNCFKKVNLVAVYSMEMCVYEGEKKRVKKREKKWMVREN